MKIAHLLLALTFSAPFLKADEVKPLFNGKDLQGWNTMAREGGANLWKAGQAKVAAAHPGQLESLPGGSELINLVTRHGQGLNLFTSEVFGDIHLEIELMVPKGSNSGVYLMGEYEVQVLDNYGKKDSEMGAGDIGAIYSAAVPKANASRAPGEWQKFVIDFRAPTFDPSGKKISNAMFQRVELNGRLLHEKVEMKGPTPGGLSGAESPTGKGPLLLQGDHGAVAFRAITIKSLAAK